MYRFCVNRNFVFHSNYFGMGSWSHIINVCLTYEKSPHCFPKWLNNFNSHQQYLRIPVTLHPCQNLKLLVYLSFSIVRMDHGLFIHLPAKGSLGYFQVWTIVNKTACEHRCDGFCVDISFQVLWVNPKECDGGIDYMVRICFLL